MARAIQCDWCGDVETRDRNLVSKFVCARERKCHGRFDGDYENVIKHTYDLCDECAGKIERMIRGWGDKDPIYFADVEE